MYRGGVKMSSHFHGPPFHRKKGTSVVVGDIHASPWSHASANRRDRLCDPRRRTHCLNVFLNFEQCSKPLHHHHPHRPHHPYDPPRHQYQARCAGRVRH